MLLCVQVGLTFAHWPWLYNCQKPSWLLAASNCSQVVSMSAIYCSHAGCTLPRVKCQILATVQRLEEEVLLAKQVEAANHID